MTNTNSHWHVRESSPHTTHGPAYLAGCFTIAADSDTLPVSFWVELGTAWQAVRQQFNLDGDLLAALQPPELVQATFLRFYATWNAFCSLPPLFRLWLPTTHTHTEHTYTCGVLTPFCVCDAHSFFIPAVCGWERKTLKKKKRTKKGRLRRLLRRAPAESDPVRIVGGDDTSAADAPFCPAAAPTRRGQIQCCCC